MVKEPTTSAVSILALFDIIEDNGISLSRLESMTGIERSEMDNPDNRITMGQFLQLWQIAEEVTGDPAIGLHLRNRYGTNIMHFVVMIALNSRNLIEAMHAWARYDRLICSTDQIDIYEKKEHYIFTLTSRSPEYENRWIPEHHYSLALDYGRKISGKNFSPVEIRFRHEDPGYREAYRDTFNCPVFFDQDENLILFRKEDMHLPIISADPYLKAILTKHADIALRELSDQAPMTRKVKKIIMKTLPTGSVSIQTISEAMAIDRSTLHRRLKKEKTTFRELLTALRKKMARVYLAQGFTATQTAYLLGFTEPSTFQRAFKGWFDQNPGEFKKHIQPMDL